MFGAGEPSQQAVEELTAKLGLDKPIWEQYIIFMKDLVTLDFGTSYRSNSPVLEMLLERAWPTLALALGDDCSIVNRYSYRYPICSL